MLYSETLNNLVGKHREKKTHQSWIKCPHMFQLQHQEAVAAAAKIGSGSSPTSSQEHVSWSPWVWTEGKLSGHHQCSIVGLKHNCMYLHVNKCTETHGIEDFMRSWDMSNMQETAQIFVNSVYDAEFCLAAEVKARTRTINPVKMHCWDWMPKLAVVRKQPYISKSMSSIDVQHSRVSLSCLSL